MTELTEKWKKGELKAGYYYVKNEFGNIFPSDYSEEYDSINDVVVKDFWTEVSEIIEVIAPVPSFEELVMMITALDKMEEEIKELKTKSAKALEYYNNVNINCNYPDKISRLKSYIKRLIEEREELKKQLEMLQNPENVTENVANQKVQHCEKRTDE